MHDIKMHNHKEIRRVLTSTPLGSTLVPRVMVERAWEACCVLYDLGSCNDPSRMLLVRGNLNNFIAFPESKDGFFA